MLFGREVTAMNDDHVLVDELGGTDEALLAALVDQYDGYPLSNSDQVLIRGVDPYSLGVPESDAVRRPKAQQDGPSEDSHVGGGQ